MQDAYKILILGGVLNLAYSFLTGVFMARIRTTQPSVPKYLIFAHTGPLMQGAMLLGLAVALPMSTLSDGLETLAALLLVAGSALLGGKDTLNWLQGVKDEFQEKPLGFTLGGLSALCSIAGIILFLVGVIGGL
jgi:hypothetical protein